MKKRRIIIGVVVLVLFIFVIAGILIYRAQPVTFLEKHINEQITLNMQENNLAWEIGIYDLCYNFPSELRGKAYLRNPKYDILIDVDRVILKPQLGSLLKSTQLYSMRGNALGGTFEGNFALGKNDDFELYFNRLSSSYIKELRSGNTVDNYAEVAVSGTLNIIAGVVYGDTNIDNIKISLPPLSAVGDLYFYDGKFSFEAVENVITLKHALIKNDDIQISVTGTITAISTDESQLDLDGTLTVNNLILAHILGLNKNSHPDGNIPEFHFEIDGPSSSPNFRFVPFESDVNDAK